MSENPTVRHKPRGVMSADTVIIFAPIMWKKSYGLGKSSVLGHASWNDGLMSMNISKHF